MKRILKNDKYMEYSIETQFLSKKNKVFKVSYKDDKGKPCIGVVKIFSKRKRQLEKEAFMLEVLRNRRCAVPEIYYKGSDFLLIEFVGGKTLLDVITEEEFDSKSESSLKKSSDNIENIIENVCSCLKSCYFEASEAMGKTTIMADMNLRNFILKKTLHGDKIYRIDFEDHRAGNVTEDLGSLCAFILSYYPAHTEWKVYLVEKFIKSFKQSFFIDIDEINAEINKSLSILNLRRINK